MTYKTALLKIKSLLKFGSKPGLKRIKSILEMIGNPQDYLKCVHVSGTNGKGSVCFLTSSILKEAGYKVGTYISPSVIDFRERIQINGDMVSEDKICELMEFFEPFLNYNVFQNDPLTEFELITAMAFKLFHDEKCDIVVLETGMGGRFDATNVIEKNLCSAITSVSLDHTQILGKTLDEISEEKLGIIKPFCPVVLGEKMPDVTYKIAYRESLKINSPVYISKTDECKEFSSSLEKGISFTYKNLKIDTPLLGEYQIKNIAVVLKIIEILNRNFVISEDSVINGFLNVHIPCRLEVINREPLIILDGAHNPAGARELSDFIKKHLKKKSHLTGIIGMFKDKDCVGVISQIAPLFDEIFTISSSSPRAISSKELSNIVRKYNLNVQFCENISQAFRKSYRNTGKNAVIIVFGSFSVMSEAVKEIKNIYN